MRRLTVVLALFLVGCTPLLADHLPATLVARGKPEHILAGVNVYKTTLDDLVQRLGRPTSLKRYPETEESAEAEWHLRATVVHASINADNIAYAVEVRGQPNALAVTGKGLALHSTLAAVKRDYGSRLLQQGDAVTLEWSDETQLRLKLDHGHIQSMLLIANVE